MLPTRGPLLSSLAGVVGSALGLPGRKRSNTGEQISGATPEPSQPAGTMSPWKVALVGIGALIVGMLLSADALVEGAERKPFGEDRDTWLAIWEPVQDVSQALYLDRPGQWVDRLTGEGKADADSFVFPDPPTAQETPPPSQAPRLVPRAVVPGTASSGVPETVSPPAQPENPITDFPDDRTLPVNPGEVPPPPSPYQWPSERALRIWVGGDSTAGVPGQSLVRLAPELGGVESTLDYRISTGLTRPDYFNWPAHLAAEMERTDPDVVVVMFGANDPQGIQTPEGEVYGEMTEGWLAEYRRRVGGTMDLLNAQGRLVIWIGEPPMNRQPLNDQMAVLNEIFRSEAEARDHVRYVDAWALLGDGNGGFQTYKTLDDGTILTLRAPDGIHFAREGGDIVAEAVLAIIAEEFGAP